MTTNPYWTEDGKAKNLALLTSTERSAMLETLRQTEAREWLQRYQRKAQQVGKQQAQAWWQGVKLDIERKRGKDSLNTLIAEMNRQRNDANSLPS
jgi:hypothetical protein